MKEALIILAGIVSVVSLCYGAGEGASQKWVNMRIENTVTNERAWVEQELKKLPAPAGINITSNVIANLNTTNFVLTAENVKLAKDVILLNIALVKTYTNYTSSVIAK